MTLKLSLLRNLAILAAMALGAPLLDPAPASAAGLCFQNEVEGGYCMGCTDGTCWQAACTDGNEMYIDGGCKEGGGPNPPSLA
jgi:hypothetical protein